MLLFLLTAREGRLWVEPIWQGKISKVGCLFQNHAARAVVCVGTITAHTGSHLVRRNWSLFIPPLTLAGEIALNLAPALLRERLPLRSRSMDLRRWNRLGINGARTRLPF
jgi:hypothetical protein